MQLSVAEFGEMYLFSPAHFWEVSVYGSNFLFSNRPMQLLFCGSMSASSHQARLSVAESAVSICSIYLSSLRCF